MRLTALGFPFCVALIAKSVIEEQVFLLKRFRLIPLIHKDGENIALRLSQQSFIKLVKKNSVEAMDSEAVKSLF